LPRDEPEAKQRSNAFYLGLTGGVAVVVVGLALWGKYSCDQTMEEDARLRKARIEAIRTGSPAMSPKEKFQKCVREKRPMMAACRPVCDADRTLVGKAYDDCLDACSRRKFGKPIPLCAHLLE
jgi:hypothetical protein